MSTLRVLTGKKVKVGIKNGMTVQDFCAKFECDPDEFMTRLGRLFTVKDTAKQVWGDIVANEKKPKAKVADVVEEVVETPKVADEVAEDESGDVTSPALTLDELKAKEAEYSDVLIEREKYYKTLYQERDEGKKKYQSLHDEIKSLKKQCEVKCHEADKVIKRDKELVDEMNAIWAKYCDERAALEAIRDQIKEMSKIVLCVYSSREIAPFDEEVEITLDDAGHEELFNQLREQEEAEDFRPKDVRTVARLMRIVANLGSPVEIIFEDEDVKTAYGVFAKST